MSVLRQSSARRPSSSLTVVWHRIAVWTGDGMAEGPSLCQHDHESVTHKNSMIVEPVMTRRSTAGPREAGRTVSVIHEMVILRSFGPPATDKQTEQNRQKAAAAWPDNEQASDSNAAAAPVTQLFQHSLAPSREVAMRAQ